MPNKGDGRRAGGPRKVPGGRSGLGRAAAGCAWLSRAPGAQHACPSFLQIQRVSSSGRRARRTGVRGSLRDLTAGSAAGTRDPGPAVARGPGGPLRIWQRCTQPTRDGAGGADRFPLASPGRLQTHLGERLPFWPLRGCMNPGTSRGNSWAEIPRFSAWLQALGF